MAFWVGGWCDGDRVCKRSGDSVLGKWLGFARHGVGVVGVGG